MSHFKDEHIDRMNEEISDEQIQDMPACELMLLELQHDADLMSFEEFEYDVYKWVMKYGEAFTKMYLDRSTQQVK